MFLTSINGTNYKYNFKMIGIVWLHEYNLVCNIWGVLNIFLNILYTKFDGRGYGGFSICM